MSLAEVVAKSAPAIQEIVRGHVAHGLPLADLLVVVIDEGRGASVSTRSLREHTRLVWESRDGTVYEQLRAPLPERTMRVLAWAGGYRGVVDVPAG